jgi:hypothetical protein
MFSHPLEPAAQRIVRACDHFNDVRQMVVGLIGKQKQTVIAHLQAHGFNGAAELNLRVNAPIELGIRVGEFCYNLRTALDYVVFELARLDSGTTQDFTQFPLVDTTDKFRAWKKQARLKRIDERHIAMMQRFQPCYGCHWAKALVRISNKDKHRGTADASRYQRCYFL